MPTVIVVDDSAEDRYVIRRLIERSHLSERVIEFTDGDLVIPLLDDVARMHTEWEAPPPPVMLLDINMPRMSGLDLLREIETRRHTQEGELPFVVLMYTSSNNPQDRAKSLCYSFVKDYLVKPIRLDDLKRVLEK